MNSATESYCIQSILLKLNYRNNYILYHQLNNYYLINNKSFIFLDYSLTKFTIFIILPLFYNRNIL